VARVVRCTRRGGLFSTSVSGKEREENGEEHSEEAEPEKAFHLAVHH
jgi:hypothetical protein